MQCVAQDLNLIEVSPTDLTAQAYSKIIWIKALGKTTYTTFLTLICLTYQVFFLTM